MSEDIDARMREIVIRMEKEIETYRQIAIEQYHNHHGDRPWDKNAERIDQEFYERMRSQGHSL